MIFEEVCGNTILKISFVHLRLSYFHLWSKIYWDERHHHLRLLVPEILHHDASETYYMRSDEATCHRRDRFNLKGVTGKHNTVSNLLVASISGIVGSIGCNLQSSNVQDRRVCHYPQCYVKYHNPPRHKVSQTLYLSRH